MATTVILLSACAILILWGIAHIAIPTRDIVNGFEPLSEDNRRILLMEWVMEGVLLIFLGSVVVLVRIRAPQDEIAPIIVYRTSAFVLLVMAGISAATGARTKILPMRLCPPIFLLAAVLFFGATLL